MPYEKAKVTRLEVSSTPGANIHKVISDAISKAEHYGCEVEVDHDGTWFTVTADDDSHSANLRWLDRSGRLRFKHLDDGEQFRRVCEGHEGSAAWETVELSDGTMIAVRREGGVTARQFERDQRVVLAEAE